MMAGLRFLHVVVVQKIPSKACISVACSGIVARSRERAWPQSTTSPVFLSR